MKLVHGKADYKWFSVTNMDLIFRIISVSGTNYASCTFCSRKAIPGKVIRQSLKCGHIHSLPICSFSA